MHCPACQSNNTKKLSMVYATGTRNYSSSSRGSGFSSRGTISSRSTRRNSSSQTALATAASPPKRNSLINLIFLFIVLPFVLMPLTSILSQEPDISIFKLIFAFILFIAFSVGAFFLYKLINKPYEKRKADWNRAWICMRCGNVYDPNEP